MTELEKHHLIFSSPHIYKCSCGYTMYWYPDGTQKLSEIPHGKIEYLKCGHAPCSKTELFDCYICTMEK